MNITFVGGGNMAGALIAGLLQKGYAAQSIRVVEISAESRERLARQYGVKTFSSLEPEAAASEIIILAVKPQQLYEVALQLCPLLSNQLIVSIAAGVRISDLARWLGNYGFIIRVMPNTPATVMSGISGLFALPDVSVEQKERAQAVMEAVGSTLWLEDESLMDAVTAISGSGPAYVFYFMEALEEAAIELGLSAGEARQLSVATFTGASRLAGMSGEDLAALRTRVTSKGGTTERALYSMETAGVKQHIIEAIYAAAERSRELGDELGSA